MKRKRERERANTEIYDTVLHISKETNSGEKMQRESETAMTTTTTNDGIKILSMCKVQCVALHMILTPRPHSNMVGIYMCPNVNATVYHILSFSHCLALSELTDRDSRVLFLCSPFAWPPHAILPVAKLHTIRQAR